MKKIISRLSMAYILFLILLFLSGALSGIPSQIVYYLAFALPIFLSLRSAKSENDESEKYLTLGSEGSRFTLPLIAPTVSLVMLAAFITSFVISSLTGKTNDIDVGDSLVTALFIHALFPAVLEEALFRYLPMRLLAPYSRRGAVVVSASFFALVHHDFFSIPYAFLAGLIFMTVDLATDSVIPSVIIHFINNAISVALLVYADNSTFAPTVFILLGALTIISLGVIFVRRKAYIERISFSLDKGEGVKITAEMLIFAGISLLIAVMSLI